MSLWFRVEGSDSGPRRKNCSGAGAPSVTALDAFRATTSLVRFFQVESAARFEVLWSTTASFPVGHESTTLVPSWAICRLAGGGGTISVTSTGADNVATPRLSLATAVRL